jgi:hypothetical protein
VLIEYSVREYEETILSRSGVLAPQRHLLTWILLYVDLHTMNTYGLLDNIMLDLYIHSLNAALRRIFAHHLRDGSVRASIA